MGLFDFLFGKKAAKSSQGKPAPQPPVKMAPPVTQPGAPPATQPPRKPTIMVVDDEEAIAAVLSEFLEIEGFKVVTAAEGWQAAVQAEAMRLDLIVMDLMMPGPQGTGFDAYVKIRASHAVRKDLPIVFLTALQKELVLPKMPPDPRVRVLFKPIDFPVLRATIKELTGR